VQNLNAADMACFYQEKINKSKKHSPCILQSSVSALVLAQQLKVL